ncbi:hypothetical protein PUNSTDRAFT_72248 [Punctularia strigosozonata HHB-11173 SS5]|uniref:uncharacterized protein n=1 Tax=Punctularia strigosozonata (strain HHB-11173) TaxID=741275 RepID=UPI00044180F5|nr:uncharacterized protein PUNSTDRAFT_72248 [Punctularia strigosozonata HHB-11173 SS5]EIN06590.1 hypothetical protein PUNSTDRAFT_72248 [Punctularia strigosozonata HHB-11173 SS5]
MHYTHWVCHDVDSFKDLTKTRRNTRWAKLRYYVPSVAWIPQYSLILLGGDFLAGLTVASMLIPQSISYASSLSSAWSFSASIPGAVYALFGTCRQLNVAPEASLSLLVGQAIAEVLHDQGHSHPPDPSRTMHVSFAVSTMITAQAGLITFLLGFFRLGFIDVVLSRALLQGFVCAIAVLIMIEQLIPMFGLSALEQAVSPHSTLDKLVFLVENIREAHVPTATVSLSALLALVVLRAFKRTCGRSQGSFRVFRLLPEVFLVVLLSTILCSVHRWDEDGVAILGDVPVSLASHSFVRWPFNGENLKYLRRTTTTAGVVSIIGFLDSIVAAKQNGARFQYAVSANRELVALGLGNVAGSFVPGTLPAYGSITRSRINGDVGGRTQMASLVCSGIILLATFFLLPYLYFLPKCVLASIICLIVFSLLSEAPHDIKFFWRMHSAVDLGLMFLTFFLSIVWDVEIGLLVSVIISLLLVVRRSSKTRMTILGRIHGTNEWEPIDENPDAIEDVPGVLIIRIRENLDFANTAQLKERLRRLELYGVNPSHPSEEPRRQQASVLVFHLADVNVCDAAAAQIFYELLETYKARDVGIFITHLRVGPRKQFKRAGIVDLLGEGAFYDSVKSAMSRIGLVHGMIP